MKKRLINHHKLKKKISRKLKKSSNFLLFRARHDSIPTTKFQNPYTKNRSHFDNKLKFKLLIIVISIAGMVAIFLYHPYFSISSSSIEIIGNQRIGEEELRATVLAVGSGRKFFLFPGNSFLVINLEEVQDVIKSRFPISSITVKKTFPNKISVLIEEKISTLIYDNGQMYSYLGIDGKIVENIRQVGDDEWNIVTRSVTSTNEQGNIIEENIEVERNHVPSVKNIISEMGDYPIVYDLRVKQGSVNDIVLGSGIAESIISWFNLLGKRTDIPFGYITIENELGDGLIKTREGWTLKVKLDKNIDAQFEELQLAIKQKIKRDSLNYIDLRFPNKVYWQ